VVSEIVGPPGGRGSLLIGRKGAAFAAGTSPLYLGTPLAVLAGSYPPHPDSGRR